jgi:hypothetical protein
VPAVRPVKAPSVEHSNADLVVWACYVAGGYERWIDVEELYLKAFELGPNRLAWRTRPDLPDYKKCAKALQEVEDPKRSDHLGLFLKQGRYTRKLSDQGLEWCLAYRSLLEGLYGGGVVRSQQGSEMSRVLVAVERSDIFRRFTKTGVLECELWELAEALQCLLGSDRAVWMARLDRLKSAAEHNQRGDVSTFVVAAREKVDSEVAR